MDYSVYSLFGLDRSAAPLQILARCRQQCSEWSIQNVRRKLGEFLSEEQATLVAEKVFMDGEQYLKSCAAILLDPSSRQCYDAWLDAIRPGEIPEKMTLTRSRLLWFNQTTKSIKFSDEMIERLNVDVPTCKKRKRSLVSMTTAPTCRSCHLPFNFEDDYLVLHCHCTTRVGHVKCLNDFAKRMKDKCPVCRQTLLKRHQVSKYLFWNVKEKYKFV